MPYDWINLPSTMPGRWLPYSQMLNEFARELANSINGFTGDVRRLRAWSEIVQTLSNPEKLEVLREFIDPLSISAMIFPYAIKARFAFAVAHLSHQANRLRSDDWLDDLKVDHEIHFGMADAHAGGWRSYKRFKRAAEDINKRQFQEATGDFRNAYNHRFPPRMIIGITGIVKRHVPDDGSPPSYRIGGLPPLDLAVVVKLLKQERDRCYVTFDQFRDLVNEQTEAIAVDGD
ncbi:integrase [Georhizobium profundi]|uniref:Integrase n=2 Tax=Georhizobium profundi TaxID=2341112 RepID=A0A3S9B978_9HYPH|nr:integrase [Georhizobium profundi]